MGKAYNYNAFRAANGNTAGLADCTSEYNEVMRSPERETQFLIVKSNSNFVLPEIQNYYTVSFLSATNSFTVDASDSTWEKYTEYQGGRYAQIFRIPKTSIRWASFSLVPNENITIESCTTSSISSSAYEFKDVYGSDTKKFVGFNAAISNDVIFQVSTKEVVEEVTYNLVNFLFDFRFFQSVHCAREENIFVT